VKQQQGLGFSAANLIVLSSTSTRAKTLLLVYFDDIITTTTSTHVTWKLNFWLQQNYVHLEEESAHIRLT